MIDEMHAARYRRAIDEARECLESGLVLHAHNILRRARGLPPIEPLRRDPPPPDAGSHLPGEAA